jgi:uncharacterized membrane protein YfcA
MAGAVAGTVAATPLALAYRSGVTLSEALLLTAAGVGAGLTGSVAGLASLISYPALLLTGLSPLAANVTNTTAMFATTVGAVAGSQPELRGQGRRLLVLGGQAVTGGAIGAVLLLTTPASAFEAVVPWLVGLGAVLLLLRDRLADWSRRRSVGRPGSTEGLWGAGIVLVGVYGGYFGAGAGIIMLSVLSLRATEPLRVTNAVKNVATGLANLVATAAYLVLAPVHLGAAAALGAGALVGSWLGPKLVRVLPETPLRLAIGVAGLGLAGWLLAS